MVSSKIIPDAELAVLARIADRFLSSRPFISQGHRTHSLKSGQGFEFLDYHDYNIGDDPRNVDWRATARLGMPQIRRRCDELTDEWTICVDQSSSMFLNQSEKWTLACQIGIALTYILLHLNNRVGLILFRDEAREIHPAAAGHTQFIRIADTLSKIRGGDNIQNSSLENMSLKLKKRNPTVIISDFLMENDPAIDLRRIAQQNRQLHVFHIYSENEINLLARGWTTLLDTETKATRVLNLSSKTIGEGNRLMQTNLNKIRNFCHAYNAGYALSDCGQDWKSILLKHITHLMPSHVLF